jgi:hypothetical protein
MRDKKPIMKKKKRKPSPTIHAQRGKKNSRQLTTRFIKDIKYEKQQGNSA